MRSAARVARELVRPPANEHTKEPPARAYFARGSEPLVATV